MIEINPAIIAALGGIGALAFTVFGMWVKFTNDITRTTVKQEDHDVRLTKMEGTLNDHDGRINNALMEIKEGIHRIELQIAKDRKE